MMGVAAVNAVSQHGSENKAVRSRNRAKLANFEAENDAYLVDQMLQDVAWKDRVSTAEDKIDNYWQQTAQSFTQQDVQMEQVYDEHVFNVLDTLKARYKNEYAGEQTGVTAQRLADAPVREAGMALTASVAKVLYNKNAAEINKDMALARYKTSYKQEWDSVRIAPQRTHTPLAPKLEKEAGFGSLLGRIAIGVGSAYLGGKASSFLGNKAKGWLGGLGKAGKSPLSDSFGKSFDWSAGGDLSGAGSNLGSVFNSSVNVGGRAGTTLLASNRSKVLGGFNIQNDGIGYGGSPYLQDFLHRPKPRTRYMQGNPFIQTDNTGPSFWSIWD